MKGNIIKAYYLLIFSLFTCSLEAQTINKLYVELNLGRYAKEPGLFESTYYSNTFSYLNGFTLGYGDSEKWQYYFGARKLNAIVEFDGGYSHESCATQGVELKFGARFTPKSHKKLFLSYGFEMFNEISRLEGTYWRDYPPDNVVNHRKNYFGFAPNLGINVKLGERVVFFADTRYRFGWVTLARRGHSEPGKEYFHNREYWTSVFEPASSIGFRFHLKS